MGEMKPTPGPWEAERIDNSNCFDIKCECGFFIATCHDGVRSESNAEANARLIAEAGTVFHNTGLSPVQLVEMVKELRETLLNLYYYVSCNMKSGLPHGVNISGKEFIDARAALFKCAGVE